MFNKVIILPTKALLAVLLAEVVVVCLSTRVKPIVAKQVERSGYKDYYLPPGTTAAEILQARGFIAEDLYFKTSEGYVLNIVRGRNPLFEPHGCLKHKRPILFVHGAITSAPIWVVNSRDAQADDYTKLVGDFREVSLNELIQRLGHFDASRSLPMLALNLGHEVWLVNRRGMFQSEQKAGHLDRNWPEVIKAMPRSFIGGGFSLTAGMLPKLSRAKQTPSNVTISQIVNAKNVQDRRSLVNEFWFNILTSFGPITHLPRSLESLKELKRQVMHTFDPDYWNFSFDEQAKYDLPQIIDFVLESSGHKKVHVITESAAGPIALLALTEHPDLADKGSKTDVFSFAVHAAPFIQSYIGPIPFSFLTKQIESVLIGFCGDELRQRTICSWLMDAFSGESGSQSPPARHVLSNVMQPTSSREIQHIIQMTRTLKPRKFNYNSKKENIEKYGSAIPPEYDFSKIRLENMSLYTGVQDRITSPDMMKMTVSQLSVPYKMIFINETGILFNHAGPILHDQNVRLIVLPSMMEIELEESDQNSLESEL